jgi:hypothetical protein
MVAGGYFALRPHARRVTLARASLWAAAMTRLFRLLPVLALAALALTGCHRRARAARATAAVSVQAAPSTGGAHVSVSHRHYRNLVRVASRDMQCHHRNLETQEVSPGIFSISGCGQLRDYVMVCEHRRACRWMGVEPVERVAMAETRCATGQILVQPTGPLARQVTACGQTLQYALGCSAGGCGWMRGGVASGMVMQTEPGTAVLVIPDMGGGQSGGVIVQEGAFGQVGDENADVVQVGAADVLQGLLATQLAAVRACSQGQTVTLQVRWSAQGHVGVALAPPLAGSAVEACVQQAIGNVVLQGVGAAGAIEATL